MYSPSVWESGGRLHRAGVRTVCAASAWLMRPFHPFLRTRPSCVSVRTYWAAPANCVGRVRAPRIRTGLQSRRGAAGHILFQASGSNLMPGTKCGYYGAGTRRRPGHCHAPAFVQLALAAISRLASHFTRESATDSSNSTSESSSCLYVKRLTTTATMRLTAKPGMIS